MICKTWFLAHPSTELVFILIDSILKFSEVQEFQQFSIGMGEGAGGGEGEGLTSDWKTADISITLINVAFSRSLFNSNV